MPPGVDSLTSPINSLEATRDEVDLVALKIEYNLGFATLTSASSFAHHNNQTDSDLTALYKNFYFYQNFYGQNPRTSSRAGSATMTRSGRRNCVSPPRPGTCSTGWGALFFKHQQTYIQEHEFYPGYNEFYNACTAAGGTVSDFGRQCIPVRLGEYGPLTGTTHISAFR